MHLRVRTCEPVSPLYHWDVFSRRNVNGLIDRAGTKLDMRSQRRVQQTARATGLHERSFSFYDAQAQFIAAAAVLLGRFAFCRGTNLSEIRSPTGRRVSLDSIFWELRIDEAHRPISCKLRGRRACERRAGRIYHAYLQMLGLNGSEIIRKTEKRPAESPHCAARREQVQPRSDMRQPEH